MLIFAIDPGNIESAYVVYDTESLEILDKNKIENELLRKEIIRDRGFIDWYAIEMIASYGMPVGASVFETCLWIGRFFQTIIDKEKNRNSDFITLITRNEVKNCLCHSSRAKDANIRQVVIDCLGPPGTKKNPGKTYGVSNDMWSALAVAMTWERMVTLGEKRKYQA